MVVQAEEELQGDDDEGGGLQVVPRQDGMRRGLERVERLIRHAGTRHQPADPQVELVCEEEEESWV